MSILADSTIWLVATLVFVLCLVTGASFSFEKVCQDEAWRDAWRGLTSRVRAWWAMTAIFVLVLLTGGAVSLVIWAATSIFALREYSKAVPLRGADRRALLWAYFGVIPVQYWLLWTGWYELFAIFVPVYGFILVPLRMILADDALQFFERTAKLQWGLMICVYFLSHAPALMVLLDDGTTGPIRLFFFFLVVELVDVLQFFLGRLFGKRQLFPRVSPEKNLAGICSALLAGSLLGTVAGPHLALSPAEGTLIGFVVGLMGQAGDVTMAAIKRDGNWSRSGTLAEHDVIDRIDSLCFAAPVYFHLLRYLA